MSKNGKEAHKINLLDVSLKFNSEFPCCHDNVEPTINYLIYRVFNMKTNQQFRTAAPGTEKKIFFFLVQKFIKKYFPHKGKNGQETRHT